MPVTTSVSDAGQVAKRTGAKLVEGAAAVPGQSHVEADSAQQQLGAVRRKPGKGERTSSDAVLRCTMSILRRARRIWRRTLNSHVQLLRTEPKHMSDACCACRHADLPSQLWVIGKASCGSCGCSAI